MNIKSEKGAVIIEATLSLSFFMFAIITLYTMFHVSLAQARIGTALNKAAKEISQYSYVYSLTGLNDKQSEIAANGGAAKSIFNDELSDVETFYDALSGIANGASSILSSPEDAESFLYYAFDQGIDQVKASAAGALAKGLMKKNFGSDPDGFLVGLGIKEGMDGLNFSDTRIFNSGEENNITLNVRYKVTVVRLLDIDMDLEFEQCAQTRAWVGS